MEITLFELLAVLFSIGSLGGGAIGFLRTLEKHREAREKTERLLAASVPPELLATFNTLAQSLVEVSATVGRAAQWVVDVTEPTIELTVKEFPVNPPESKS